jgi:hypothetical protein
VIAFCFEVRVYFGENKNILVRLVLDDVFASGKVLKNQEL